MFHLHTIQMPDGGGPSIPDRLTIASVLGLPTAAAANGIKTAGAVTAGSLYTATPVITPTGGTKNAAAPAGAYQAAGGWDAIVRVTLKVVGTPTVGVGGSGYVAADTVTFSNGVVLNAATVVGGAVTVWSINAAGSFVGPGGVPVNPVSQISTNGVGVGATANLSWGLNTAIVDDSGNYSVIPTGFTVTPAAGDTTGTTGAIAAPTVAGAGDPVFRAIGPFPADGIPSSYGVIGISSGASLTLDADVELANKINGYASVRLMPRIAANAVGAGTLDALIWA